MRNRFLIATITGFATSVASAPALAADSSPVADVFSQDRWGLGLGAFAGFQPAYEGSDEYRFVAYPLVLPKYFGENYDPDAPARIEFKGIDDVRLTAVRLGGLDLGPVVGYDFGREENLSTRLGGLGDVDGGVNLGAFASYRYEDFYADLAYVDRVSGDIDTGYTIRFGAGTRQAVNERLDFSAYFSGSYASEDYMDAYFSVTPAQAAASLAGLPAYDAGSGFKDVGLDLGFDYKVTDRMTLRTRAGYSRLLGDAAASPVTASRDQFSGGLGVTYTFGRTE